MIEEEDGVYGAFFPQFPGCVAMGATMEAVVRNATDALAEWIGDERASGRTYEPDDFRTTTGRAEVQAAIGAGATPIIVPLVSESGRPIRANLSLDAGLLDAIDAAARERGMTRSSWLASAARTAQASGH